MKKFFDPKNCNLLIEGLNHITESAKEISEELYEEILNRSVSETELVSGPDGMPLIIQRVIGLNAVLSTVDAASDNARGKVAGDPLRAVEYDRAASEARAFSDAGFEGDAPPMVASWAINGRSTEDAARDILREAQQYSDGLAAIRAIRLQAKEDIRALFAKGDTGSAKIIADSAIEAINNAVAGIGNNV